VLKLDFGKPRVVLEDVLLRCGHLFFTGKTKYHNARPMSNATGAIL